MGKMVVGVFVVLKQSGKEEKEKERDKKEKRRKGKEK
jgi:hypothetical protein